MEEKTPAEIAAVVAAAHSPVVGEKRLREEDEHEQRDAQNDRQSIPGFKSDSPSASIPGNPSSNANGAQNGQVANSDAGGGNKLDALYIGDLQWVCTSSCFSSHVCTISETTRCMRLFHSGRLMRTCGKSPSPSVSYSTTRISRSPSTKLMARVRGKCVQHRRIYAGTDLRNHA